MPNIYELTVINQDRLKALYAEAAQRQLAREASCEHSDLPIRPIQMFIRAVIAGIQRIRLPLRKRQCPDTLPNMPPTDLGVTQLKSAIGSKDGNAPFHRIEANSRVEPKFTSTA